MFSNYFLHPDHIIPAVEFISAVMEPANLSITEMTVKMLAVPGQIFILGDGIRYTGETSQQWSYAALFLKTPAYVYPRITPFSSKTR